MFGPHDKAPVVPTRIRETLQRIGGGRVPERQAEPILDDAMAWLSDLPVSSLAEVERKLHAFLYLHPHSLGSPGWLWAASERPIDFDLLDKYDQLKYLFLFHASGYLREAALSKIADAPNSPFLFAAIVWRLNDWVLPVRRAAARCAATVFPHVSGDVIAVAAMGLLVRQSTWRRWGDSERVVLEGLIQRPDVAKGLAASIARATIGPAGAVLRYALRRDGLDPYLELLARSGVQPSVRAVALQTLIDGSATWPDGFETQWVDRSMGISRRIPKVESRPIELPRSREEFIKLGIRDRSAIVRRVALDGLIRHQSEVPAAAEIARPFIKDRRTSLRERAEFVMKRAAKMPNAAP